MSTSRSSMKFFEITETVLPDAPAGRTDGRTKSWSKASESQDEEMRHTTWSCGDGVDDRKKMSDTAFACDVRLPNYYYCGSR
ncbi:hypothetical protein AXG93_3817s1280 [Marchantia polymorpha subsp. ruderalis]|uniref:Uncharacterized protein n=1 Tax=Marchantia polymorpha subsp. ruderalis TaxID=1480154 RepID=A0A176W252_MARPO|nr:hypothetical protein AXG93_3817s1280 [Marchantia polymorpha subsp. ruderalis]